MAKIQIVVNIEIDTDDNNDISYVKRLSRDAIQRDFGNGAFTGNTDIEIESFDIEVKQLDF